MAAKAAKRAKPAAAVKPEKVPAPTETNTIKAEPDVKDKKAEKAAKKAEKDALKAEKKAEKAAAKKARLKEKGFIGRVLPGFIVLLLIAGIAAALWFNIFNLRNKYLLPTLQKIPIVNNVIPVPSEDGTEVTASRNELLTQIEDLQNQLKKSQDEVKALNEKNALFAEQITSLKAIESQQLKFKEDKAAFDKLVAEGNPQAYVNYYEQISPENSQQLYNDAKVKSTNEKDLKNYIATYQAMDEAAAAAMLEELMTTDSELVVLILRGVDSKKSAEILAGMDPVNSASITKQMFPTTATLPEVLTGNP